MTPHRRPARALLALTLFAACSDAALAPTAPPAAAKSGPQFLYEANDGGVPGTAPEPDVNYRRRITPQSVRVFPSKVFDVIESVSQNVANNPNYSAADRQLAQDALRDLPRMRSTLTAPIAPRNDLSYLRVSDPRSGWAAFADHVAPSSVELWDMMQSGGTNATAAVFGTPPGAISFGQLYGTPGGVAENSTECGKEVWEWAKSIITMTTGVLTIASGVAGTAATAGAAAPIAWPVVGAGVVTFGVGIGDLWFSQQALSDCLMRENRKKYYPGTA